MPANSYQKLQKIGEGTYGIVYKAINKNTGELVALKKIRPDSENEGIPATTIREIILLKKLKHSTIINLMEIIHSGDSMYLAFEYVDYDLKFVLENRKMVKLPFETARKMCHQLMTAVAYCHSMGIFHRDLKPQNILVDKTFNIKVADFGLGRATIIPLRAYTPSIITLWYRPPELLLGEEYYDPRVDVWSLGCIFIEIFTLVPFFTGDSEIDQLHKIFSVLGTPDNKLWPNVENLPKYKNDFPKYKPMSLSDILRPENLNESLDSVDLNEISKYRELVDLIQKMLVYNPMDRLTAEKALKHNFFKGLKTIHK